jgi:phytoene dehydrogenase-like protein
VSAYKVGDVVWLVLDRGEPKYATITNVGRRWAVISTKFLGREFPSGRFDMATGAVDGRGYTSPGRVYRSKAEHDEARQLLIEWTAFRRAVEGTYRVPKGVTLNQIRNAQRALFPVGPSDKANKGAADNKRED